MPAFMSEYLGIARDRIEVSPLGISLEGHAPVSPVYSGPLKSATSRESRRRRGFTSWRGSVHDERTGRASRRRIPAAGARQVPETLNVKYEGSPDRAGKIAFLQSIDVFSMPSPYADPKGLSLLEAMANGVPVVQPSHGAFRRDRRQDRRRCPV